jgi:hypothetical protein
MTGEVLRISEQRLGTEVKYRVSSFHNFGERMDDISQQYLMACREEAGVERDQKVRRQIERVTGLLDGVLSWFGGGERIDTTHQEEIIRVPDSYYDDPHVLTIRLESPQKWTAESQARIDGFLAAWPRLREKVLQAVFDTYREQYDEIWQFLGRRPADGIRYPDPTNPRVIENHFVFCNLYLAAESDSIGLEGVCEWDDEHGIGARFESGECVEIGGADTAFVY